MCFTTRPLGHKVIANDNTNRLVPLSLLVSRLIHNSNWGSREPSLKKSLKYIGILSKCTEWNV